jgi:hypothetical protein
MHNANGRELKGKRTMFPNFEVMALVYQDMLSEAARNRYLAEQFDRPSRLAHFFQQVRMLLF